MILKACVDKSILKVSEEFKHENRTKIKRCVYEWPIRNV